MHELFAPLLNLWARWTARRPSSSSGPVRPSPTPFGDNNSLTYSEQRLADAQQVAHVGSWIWGLADNSVAWSDELYRIYGLEPQSCQVTYESFLERVHPEDREAVAHAVRESARTHADFQFDHRIVRPDGAVRMLQARGRVIVAGDGRAVRMIGTGQDITERKAVEQALQEANDRLKERVTQRTEELVLTNDDLRRENAERTLAEAALRESEALFRSTADSVPVLLWVAGADGLCTWFNTRWLEFRGRTLEEERGDGWSEGVHADDLQHCMTTYRAALADQRGFEMEYRLQRHDGAYRWVLDTGVPRLTSTGAFLGFIGSCFDITDRKEAEGIRRQLAAIVESSEDAIFSKTLDGIVTSWNKAAERLYGYSADEMVGQHIAMVVPPDLHDGLKDLMSRLRRGERIVHYETQRIRKDGVRIDVSVTLSPMADDSGRLVGASVIARDITEQKRAEERMRSSLREKEVLLKEIHHRVKNNLQVISSLLSLQSGTIRDPNVLKLFQESQNRIRSMALVHERLYASSDLSRVDVDAYLRSVTGHLMRSYATGDAVLLDVEAGGLFLGVDVVIPCGLIINELVSNAIKHAFPDGRRGRIVVGLRADGDEALCLEVRDDGVGIPASVDPARTESLGLRLVVALTEQLGGTLEVVRGHGSRFIARFPCREIFLAARDAGLVGARQLLNERPPM